MLSLLLLATAAYADCTPYGADALVTDLQSLQLALRALDESSYNSTAEKLYKGLPCLTAAAPAPVFASAYRYIGTWYHLKGEDSTARRYYRSALEIDPNYQWDAGELDMDSPIRTLFDEERAHATDEAVLVRDHVLATGSTWTLDGRSLTKLAATTDRPHLLMKLGKDKAVEGIWVVDGNNFPPESYGSGTNTTPEVKAKKEKQVTKNVTTTSSVATIERKRPPEKTPLIILGAVGVAAAGGVYGYTFVTHKQFEEATTQADLDAKQSLTNALIVSSGGLLLVGLGVGYWGIVLDGGGAVGVSGQF